jgi:carbonic anhydrase/acetyltransferase-like protein (isoleucine patch superfamily)
MANHHALIYPFKGRYPSIHPSVFMTAGVVVIGDVSIGEGSSVWFNTVIRGDVNTIRIGARTNLQDNSTLHVTWKQYSLSIGDDVTIGHSAVLHGCTVHDRVLVGMNATVLDGAVIESDCLIAAGTLVRTHQHIPEGSLVAGVPGKVVRRLSDEERAFIQAASEHYQLYVHEFRTHGDMERGLEWPEYLRSIGEGA